MTEEHEDQCYHCGLPIPRDVKHSVSIDGVRREMCCIGCMAVAQSIVESGLTEYYRHRDSIPASPREELPVELKELGLFDNLDFQRRFVREAEGGEKEADLILEGITCSACVWLNERHVMGLPGVRLVHINYATRRARVRWDEEKIKLSEILAAIQAIGYQAYPYDAERSEQHPLEPLPHAGRAGVGIGVADEEREQREAHALGDGGRYWELTRQVPR